MFAKRKAVLKMPADPVAYVGDGAMKYAGFRARVAAILVNSAIAMIFGIALIPSALPAPAESAAVEIKPVPARPAALPVMMAEAAPKPAPKAASSAGEKPKAKRRAAPRKPAVPMTAAEAPPAPPAKTPKYNDVMTAVMYRDYLAATELLDLGWWADRPDSNGVTPLMAAAMNGDALIAQLLLKHGANPNRSGPGGSVLSYAGRSGDAKLVALLKQAGAR